MDLTTTQSVAGTVILYHPDAKTLDNIRSYLSSIQRLYVFDNTEKQDERISRELKELQKLAYFHDGSNAGIARRLNQAVQSARSEGFGWLLTMDQDSSFREDHLQKSLDCVTRSPD